MRTLHIADPDCPETKTGYVTTRPAGLLCAADHPAQPVEWLWQHRIPLGKVTLLAGDPGLGKSLLALDIAARVTRGQPFPDHQPPALPGVCEPANETQASNGRTNKKQLADSPNPDANPRQSRGLSGEHTSGSVLILSASDDFADTIRPRLEAAGADLARIFTESSITDLRHDFAELEAVLDAIPDCRLIIVDPVGAFVGPGDSHYHTVVRRVLMPLTRLAAERRIAVLAISQFRKNDGATIHRAAGSTGFVAAARSLWTVSRDPRDATRNLFLPIKQNLTHAACGLAYRIAHTSGAFAPHIRWEPDTEVPSTEDAFARPKKPPEPSPERMAARQWLAKTLASGPRPARHILAEGRQFGFLERTLQRAFHELGGSTAKRGLVEGWWWSVEKSVTASECTEWAKLTNDAPDTPQKTPDAFEGVTYEEDTAGQAALDSLLNEPFTHYLRQPSVKEPSAPQKRREQEREPAPAPAPNPNSLTDHPALDQILQELRDSLSTAPIRGGGHHEVVGSAFSSSARSSNASSAAAQTTNPHPTPATKAAATTHPHKSHSPGSTAQSPAPPPPARPTRAPDSSAGSNCSRRESCPTPP
jgi:putative DNA primase/helicase